MGWVPPQLDAASLQRGAPLLSPGGRGSVPQVWALPCHLRPAGWRQQQCVCVCGGGEAAGGLGYRRLYRETTRPESAAQSTLISQAPVVWQGDPGDQDTCWGSKGSVPGQGPLAPGVKRRTWSCQWPAYMGCVHGFWCWAGGGIAVYRSCLAKPVANHWGLWGPLRTMGTTEFSCQGRTQPTGAQPGCPFSSWPLPCE